MFNENETSEKLKGLLYQYFKENSLLSIVCSHRHHSFHIDKLRDFISEKALQPPNVDYPEEISSLWDMSMQRIVEPVFDISSGGLPYITAFRLTEYGKNLLQGLPIDRPNEYIDYLKSQVPDIDSQSIVYVRESLHSYNLGCYFAASVMLGVAAERLFELLIHAYTSAIQSPNAKKQFQKRTVGRGISQQYDEFKKKLPDLVGSNGITTQDGPSTRRLRDEFKHAIEITFDSIRSYRDYAAHPRDGQVPRHIIMGNLNTFPLFCQRVYQGIGWLGEED